MADGRPAPLTKRQVERMEEKKQISVCFILFRSLFVSWLMYTCTCSQFIGFFLFFQKRVYKLLGEINYAKERHRRLTEEKQAEKPFPLKPKS